MLTAKLVEERGKLRYGRRFICIEGITVVKRRTGLQREIDNHLQPALTYVSPWLARCRTWPCRHAEEDRPNLPSQIGNTVWPSCGDRMAGGYNLWLFHRARRRMPMNLLSK